MSGGGGGGWIISTYDRSKFKMNEKRSNSFLGCAESVQQDLGQEDYLDMLLIHKLLMNNEISTAVRCYRNLDTIVRDYCPQWMDELAESSINPAFFIKEETLEATEEKK
jgi:hypothetical protein